MHGGNLSLQSGERPQSDKRPADHSPTGLTFACRQPCEATHQIGAEPHLSLQKASRGSQAPPKTTLSSCAPPNQQSLRIPAGQIAFVLTHIQCPGVTLHFPMAECAFPLAFQFVPRRFFYPARPSPLQLRGEDFNFLPAHLLQSFLNHGSHPGIPGSYASPTWMPALGARHVARRILGMEGKSRSASRARCWNIRFLNFVLAQLRSKTVGPFSVSSAAPPAPYVPLMARYKPQTLVTSSLES